MVMLGFLDESGNYYEAESLIGAGYDENGVQVSGAVEVPRRPSARHQWMAGAWVNVPLTADELAAIDSDAAKAELARLDLASIRDIRAYIASKPDAPQMLKDRESASVAARARVLP